jgi:Undecaprenyl-phosphate glucose phosphotransferase
MVRTIDVFLVVVSGVAVFALYTDVRNYPAAEIEQYLLASLVAGSLFAISFQRIGGYSLKRLSMLRWQLTRAAGAWSVTIGALLLVGFISKASATYYRGWALAWMLTALAFIWLERGIVRFTLPHCVKEGFLAHNIVIVGAGKEGERLITKLLESHDKSIVIQGVFDDRKSRVPDALCGYNVIGTTEDLLTYARQMSLEQVIIALPLSAQRRIKTIVDKLKVLPVDLRLSAASMAENFPLRGMSYLGEAPLLGIVDQPIKNWSAIAKRVEDKILSAVLLFALAPAMAMIALLIKLESPGPVFFVQERFGFNNNPIRVVKFRTMYTDRTDVSGAQRTIYADPRVTRVGRVLRPLSLDELPQLFNVWRGDMSLIGPRPHATAMRAGNLLYCDAIEEYAQRHRVMPGITGWAQVNGYRGEIDNLEKARARIEHDLFYIEHWSFWLDWKILCLTLPAVLMGKNAY